MGNNASDVHPSDADAEIPSSSRTREEEREEMEEIDWSFSYLQAEIEKMYSFATKNINAFTVVTNLSRVLPCMLEYDEMHPSDADAEIPSSSQTTEEIDWSFPYLQTEIERMFAFATDNVNALTEATNLSSLLPNVLEYAEILRRAVLPEQKTEEVKRLKSLLYEEKKRLLTQNYHEKVLRLKELKKVEELKERLKELEKVEELKERLKMQTDQNLRLEKELIAAKTDVLQLEDGEHPVDLAEFNLRDVSNPLCLAVRHAVSLYQGDCRRRNFSYRLKEIKRVSVVVNQRLSGVYEDAKKKFRNDGSAMEEVYAYHATDIKNVSSIIKTNLDPNRTPKHGRRHGFGCYFSEHPTFSQIFGPDCIFIFKILLVEGNYRKVQPDRAGFCQHLILSDVSMFTPLYVLYF